MNGQAYYIYRKGNTLVFPSMDIWLEESICGVIFCFVLFFYIFPEVSLVLHIFNVHDLMGLNCFQWLWTA